MSTENKTSRPAGFAHFVGVPSRFISHQEPQLNPIKYNIQILFFGLERIEIVKMCGVDFGDCGAACGDCGDCGFGGGSVGGCGCIIFLLIFFVCMMIVVLYMVGV